jgi:hypothetical protein
VRLKLISDGTPHGTRIVHTETGEVLDGVLFYRLDHEGPQAQKLAVEILIEQPTGATGPKDPEKLTGEERLRRLPPNV